MTGKELICKIVEYGLFDTEIISTKENPEDGDYICFDCVDGSEESYRYLWITDDYMQNVVYNHAGDLTFGVPSKFESYDYISRLINSNNTIKLFNVRFTKEERAKLDKASELLNTPRANVIRTALFIFYRTEYTKYIYDKIINTKYSKEDKIELRIRMTQEEHDRLTNVSKHLGISRSSVVKAAFDNLYNSLPMQKV